MIALDAKHGLPSSSPVFGRRIAHQERWTISDPAAIAELKDTPFGEQEIEEFWKRKGWRLTAREERYLVEVGVLAERGLITPITRWQSCPFAVVYQTLDRVRVLDGVVERGHEFVLDFDDDDDHLVVGNPRFSRTSNYVEDHENGHGNAVPPR